MQNRKPKFHAYSILFRYILSVYNIFIVFLLLSAQPLSGQTTSFTLARQLPCLDKKQTVLSMSSVTTWPDRSSGRFHPVRLACGGFHFSPVCISFGPCLVDTIPLYEFDTLVGLPRSGAPTGSENRFSQPEVINLYVISTSGLPGGIPDMDIPSAFGNTY